MTPNGTPNDPLRNAREPLTSLIGEMSDGALIARSVDGVILEVNRKLCDMFRVSEDVLVGQDAGRFLPLGELGNVQGEAVRRECKVTRSDGTHARVDISVTPLQNGDFMAILRESLDRRSAKGGSIDDPFFRDAVLRRACCLCSCWTGKTCASSRSMTRRSRSTAIPASSFCACTWRISRPSKTSPGF